MLQKNSNFQKEFDLFCFFKVRINFALKIESWFTIVRQILIVADNYILLRNISDLHPPFSLPKKLVIVSALNSFWTCRSRIKRLAHCKCDYRHTKDIRKKNNELENILIKKTKVIKIDVKSAVNQYSFTRVCPNKCWAFPIRKSKPEVLLNDVIL